MGVIIKNRRFVALCLILLIATALRIYQLGSVPFGVTHDELGYIFNAFSISKTEANVFGEKFPFLTWMVEGGFPFLPVPIYVSSVFFFFLPLSSFSGRLPSALLGIGDVFLLYLLVRRLFSSERLALLSSFFLAISPWHLHFSRSAYDPNFALFFFLLGSVVFLWEAEKKVFPLLSTVSFFLAVFSYRGMSVIFFPLALLLLWFIRQDFRMKGQQFLLRLLSVGFVAASFFMIVSLYGQSYTKEALFFNDPKLQESVDKEIREAKGSLQLRRIFLNKATFLLGTLSSNYLNTYSPEFLFLHTEPHTIYSIWSRGRVYFVDIFFIATGIFYLMSRKKRAAIFIFGCILLGGLPGMIGGMPYSARNFFIALFLPVLTAGGVLGVLNYCKKRYTYSVAVLAIMLVYSYSLGHYLFDYYERYAYQAAESWAKSLKDVSVLINSEKNSHDEVIVGNATFGDLVQYAFYAHISAERVQASWQDRLVSQTGPSEFQLENVRFFRDCQVVAPKQEDEKERKVLLIQHDDCDKKHTPSLKIQDYFGNTVWKVYEL
ncbi:MAG: glycosyltransferase family 39 protein [bacterium]|nr:glycosyltransferase family 39 protein [bacterium]